MNPGNTPWMDAELLAGVARIRAMGMDELATEVDE